MTMRNPDTVIGAVMAAAGTSGLTIQAVIDGLNVAVLGVNFILGLGGIALLVHRFRKKE